MILSIGALVVLVLLALFFLDQSRAKMEASFKAASMDAMAQQSAAFLQLAETHLAKHQEGAKLDLTAKQKEIEAALEPVKTSMKLLAAQCLDLEKKREGAYSGLTQQLHQMIASDRELRKETGQLAQALRSPNLRGSWGQMHLRRVVELAGLVHHCDFAEQVQAEAGGRVLRPDLVVRLPEQRQIVIDAKTPCDAYLEAAATEDEEKRARKLQEHAAMLRKHIKDLSAKEYWKAFDLSPEYVVLFLPAEAFFSAALQADPTLIEVGADQNVILATPTTLIAILRAVAFTWKQEGLSREAKEIAKLGGEFYDRLGVVCEHWSKVGRQLSGAVEAYNQAVASFETRVLVSAKKLKEQSGIAKELPPLERVEKSVAAAYSVE